MPISSPLPPPASSPLSPCRCRFPPHHRRLPCESLYEDEEFVQRQLLALVAPKVFFYLAELNGALSYVLGAGPLFDVSDNSDYAQTLLAKALDEHTAIQSRATGEEKTMYSGCRLLWKGCWTSMIVSSWYRKLQAIVEAIQHTDSLLVAARIRIRRIGIGRIRIRRYGNFLKNPIRGYILLFFK
ncbi:unnamed protein product [Miscanthus lutarioriparius]|uniref:26S proteasome non-ATPase regulatory subunit 1/RPN2 N-terminal domain-containing protein n=1 Tax=Miscanthus lutarioriparius TaxID=422564 RepID=A0A811M810_9POAL|nr:unnamed protein product [Miscanthus lutarioriparius]